MSRVKLSLFLSLFCLLFVSCQFGPGSDASDSKNSGTETSDVQFSFSSDSGNMAAMLKKSASVDSVLITIEDADSNVVHNRLKLDIYNFDGEFISSSLPLQINNYKLTEFFVMNGTDIVYAAPVEGSSLVYLALDSLPLEFSVTKDQMTKVVPQVIAAEGHSPEDFGYSSFSFEVVEALSFYVSINTFNTTTSNWELTSSELTVTCGAENILPAEALDAVTNYVTIPSAYASYTLKVEKDGYLGFEKVYSAAELLQAVSGDPIHLFINLTKDYTGKIAFQSLRDANYEIYVMDADGSNQTNITNNTSHDYYPSWSADGSKIAFQSYRDDNHEIYVMDADGSNQTNITNNAANDYYPAWSPDESQIAFCSGSNGNYQIYVMNADGSNRIRLTNNSAGDFYPSWSPDGSQIMFQSDRDGSNYEIYVMNTDGSNQTRLTNNSSSDFYPSWSPDGSQIVFRSNRDDNYEIYVMDADGSNQTRLTNNVNDDSSPSWSPDGSQIAFQSNRDGNYEIYVMNADGSNQIRLTNSATYDFKPSWSPAAAD